MRSFIEGNTLKTLYHFHNKKGIFDIHRDMKFVLLILSSHVESIKFVFNAKAVSDINDDDKVIYLI